MPKQYFRKALGIADTFRNNIISNDFLAAVAGGLAPFNGTAVASGTVATGSSGDFDKNHPGNVRIASSTNANSGYLIASNSNTILLGGREIYHEIFRPLVFSNTTTRLGFHDTQNSSDATDGCYIEIDSSGIATGKTASNSSRSSTGTTLQLSTGTWYRFKIELNSDATLVTFTIYSDAGAVLWTDTLATNIPTATGRETACGHISTNSGTVATGLASIDLIAVEFAGLSRGF